MSTDEIIETIKDLPIPERIKIVDEVIKSYSPSEKALTKEIERRVKEFESGDGKAIPGKQVISRLKEKYS